MKLYKLGRLLLILFCFTSFFVGCKVEYIYWGNYFYINKSDYTVTLNVYNKYKTLIENYNILPTDTIQFLLDGEGGTPPPFFYTTDLRYIGDSVYIAFSDLRYITFKGSDDGILSEKSYTVKEVGERRHNFYYYFTNEMFNNALEIKK